MIAERAIHSCSYGTLNELDLDGYCDFGFPAAAYELVVASLPRVSSSKLDLRSSKLDEVIRAFAKVFDGREIDTAKLLKALKAHLELMRSGGAAMCLVAKDFEYNVLKVATLYKKSPKECKTLASMLELERESGIHDGNILQEASAAMGLLWIRRSLAFQLELYASLIPSDGDEPKAAAYDAYQNTLSPYHGWMLRTAFSASLSQLPDRPVFMSKFAEVDIEELDHEHEYKLKKKLRALIGTLEPLLSVWKDNFEEMNMEDTRRV